MKNRIFVEYHVPDHPEQSEEAEVEHVNQDLSPHTRMIPSVDRLVSLMPTQISVNSESATGVER